MDINKVKLYNGGGNCMYAFIWEQDKFLCVGNNLVTVWNSEKEYHAANNGEDIYPLEVLEYNASQIKPPEMVKC